MSDSIFTVDVRDGLARLTLASPDSGNVLDLQMIRAFADAVESLAGHAVRAVLLNALGKNFCVGGDIRAFATAPDRGIILQDMAGRLHEGVEALRVLEAPVIVAVQGAAAGAGLSLAVAADIVLAGRSASFAMAYTGIGLSPDGGASYFLPRLIGLRRTQEMAFTNRRLSSDEALQYGLVTRVVDDDMLAVEAEALALRLAAGPTRAFAAVKSLLDTSGRNDLHDQLAFETQAIVASARTADAAEGFTAFLERRPAHFNGR